MRSGLTIYLATAAGCLVLGGLGAAAFNPDDGSLLHSEALWRIFGIACYLGALLLLLAPIVLVAGSLTRRWGARRS